MNNPLMAIKNGSLIPLSELTFEYNELGLHRGYGIFDFFRTRDGQLLWLDDYLTRIFNSIEYANLPIDFNRQTLRDCIYELKKANALYSSFFRILVTGGTSSDFVQVENPANWFIINKPSKAIPDSYYNEGVGLITERYVRQHPKIKSLNYFTALHLHKKLKAYNAVDVLYHDEHLTEVSKSNVFCIKDNTVYTPSRNILHGVTRLNLLKMMEGNFDYVVGDVPYDELRGFDEVFITSSSKDVLPIAHINGKPVGSGKVGPVTKAILDHFDKSVKNQLEDQLREQTT